MSVHPRIAAAALLAFALTGCWTDNSPDAASAPPAAAPAAPAPAPAPAKPAKPAKADPVALADLKAGLAAIQPRVLATVDGYQKVEPRVDARYSLHPDADKNPSIEIDTKGLKSLTLSPYIADFSKVADCQGSPKAGVVRMRWSLDGAAANELLVDRTYNATIAVDVGHASVLKVEVDQGNGVNWCDWFGLGFINVK